MSLPTEITFDDLTRLFDEALARQTKESLRDYFGIPQDLKEAEISEQTYDYTQNENESTG